MRWAYFQLVSTAGLLELHKAIQKALDEDDKLPNGQKKYGVREYPDFRQQADEIERELDKRRQEHVKIIW